MATGISHDQNFKNVFLDVTCSEDHAGIHMVSGAPARTARPDVSHHPPLTRGTVIALRGGM